MAEAKARFKTLRGWNADKYQFDVRAHSAYNVLPGTQRLKLIWKRGSKRAETGVAKVERGEAVWDETLTLAGSMFVNPKTGMYERKPTLFVLQTMNEDGTPGTTYAEATLDLLEFALNPGRELSQTVPLRQGDVTMLTHLQFSLTATPLAENVAPSEVSSVLSAADLAEVATLAAASGAPERAATTTVIGDHEDEDYFDEGLPEKAKSDDEATSDKDEAFKYFDERLAYHIEDENEELPPPTAEELLSGVDTEGGIVPGVKMMRLIVGKKCKIFVRGQDNFGNTRTTGGDNVEGVLVGPNGQRGLVSTKDHGDGSYLLEFTCMQQGVWTLRTRFNGRLSMERHKLIVSFGPLMAQDVRIQMPKPPFRCGAYTDLQVVVERPEDGRILTGAEAFNVRLISPAGLSIGVPLDIKPGTTAAIARINWPEVGDHKVDVRLDGESLRGSPMQVKVVPEELCLAACQLQGPGVHRSTAGIRSTFVIEAHDNRGNRLLSGGAPLALLIRSSNNEEYRGEIVDFGNGTYEASYTVRVAGFYELSIAIFGEELVVKGMCEPGKAVVAGCELVGDAGLDLEVGGSGRYSIIRHDAYGNRVPTRQGQVKFKVVADGPGPSTCSIIDRADGVSDVDVTTSVAGRYYVQVTAGDQEPIPGSPFEVIAYPGPASNNTSVTTVFGAQLASSDSDVLVAVAGEEVSLAVAPRDIYGNVTVFSKAAMITASATSAGVVTAFEERTGTRQEVLLFSTFRLAGSYLLHAKIGDKMLDGYPRILTVVSAATEPRKCILFGEALQGVRCNRITTLTMHASDKFGNLRSTGGDVVDVNLCSPDGTHVVAAKVDDHSDGTYGAKFKLQRPGTWEIQLVVNGRGGRTQVNEVKSYFAGVKANECTFSGMGSDGIEGVVCFKSSSIVIEPIDFEQNSRLMSGKEAVGVRILTPSGGISSVDLHFRDGRYHGSYTWTQPGQHTVSVSLDQEAIVGSPFSVEAMSALPQIAELENMTIAEIAEMLPKLSNEGASQALQSLTPDKAAEVLVGNTPESTVRMLSQVFPGDVAEILSCMPDDYAAAVLSCMPSERAAEVLGTMQAADTTKLLLSMKVTEIGEKSEMFADVVCGMKKEDMLDTVRCFMNSKSEKALRSILDKMPARVVAEMTTELNTDESSKILSGLSHERAAAVVSKLPEDQQVNVLGRLGGDSMFQMTKGLFAAYKIDKSASSQERNKTKAEAIDTGRRLAPALARMAESELCEIFKSASPEHISGVLFALVEDKRRSVHSLAAARPVAQMLDSGTIEWGDGSTSVVDEAGTSILHSDGTVAELKEDGTIIDNDGQVLKLRSDGIITADGTVLGEDGKITAGPSGAVHLYRSLEATQCPDTMIEVVNFCPPGTAGEILIDLTQTELRETLAPLSAAEQAKIIIEVGRLSPSQAARAVSILSHTEAASVVSILVNPGSSGRCDEPFMGPFLELLSPQILRNVEPATAVGGALATHLSPTSAATVLHKLEPMDVSRIIEGMSPAEVRQVLEASAALLAGNGKAVSDTPLVAALVPYVSGMDNSQAAALLESLPQDMAVGIMMCTPEERANEIMEHTRRRDLKERVENKSLIHLDACTIVNLRGAVAGESSTFILEARERGGNRIKFGGGHLTVSTKLWNAPGPGIEVGTVHDRGNGEYLVQFTSSLAGKIAVIVETAGQSRTWDVNIEASDVVISKCTIEKNGLEGWTAGTPGKVLLTLRDRFGNFAHSTKSILEFEARASGPGGVNVERNMLDDGRIEFVLNTTVTGIYKIAVSCLDTKEDLSGCPFEARMGTGTLSQAGCTAMLQSLTSSTKGPGAKVAAFGACAAMAGEEVTCVVEARDRYGNNTTFAGENVTVVAYGPAHLPAERPFEVADVRSGRMALRAIFPRSGSYTVSVTVDGIPIASSPLILHVFPGACETSRAVLRGDALNGIVASKITSLLVQTEDKYGNHCHIGGDRVNLSMSGPNGIKVNALDVKDNEDGTYSFSFIVPQSGRWTIQAVVNGRVAKESTTEVVVTYGPLHAAACVLKGGPGMKRTEVCGAQRDIYLQALEYDANGRGMSGQEAITMHMITPSGATHTLPAVFAERGSRYKATVRWWEVGRHEIVAAVGGEPVVGSPFVVDVEAQEVSLPMCRLSGPGLQGAVAGERATILIESRDERGNRLFNGGAQMGIAVRSGGETLRGKVQDCGDGTYEASYIVERAGPFELSLFLGTEAATYRAVCKPGRVDYAKCQVDGVTNGVWIAGEQLTLTVTRMDRFGNRITRREGLAPFFGKAIGPGEVTSQSVELGNGTAEIKLYGTVSGTYQLGVYVADTPIVPYANEEAAALMEGEQLMLEENKSEHSSKKSANTKADSKLIGLRTDSLAGTVRSISRSDAGSGKAAIGVQPAVLIDGEDVEAMNEIELPKITKMDGITMVPLPRGLFEMNLNPAVAMPNCCELEVIGGTRADNSWIAPAGDEVVVRVIARDKYKNDTHWEEGQNITVEALGPEFLSFAAHGTTSLQNEFVAKMTRAGTFELRVLCDALPVCWRAMQIIAGFTFPPRSILSMDGLKDVKTGDIVRLTLRTVDKYANLRLSGGDTVQVVLQGPNGALARQVSVTDHQDGTYALEFQVTAAGRWILNTRINSVLHTDGGISFVVAFGTLTAEEAVLVFDPPLPANASVECGQASDLRVYGLGWETNNRVMTGLEAVSVRLTHPSGSQEAVPVTLAQDNKCYSAKIRWLHPGVHSVNIMLDGVVVPGTPIRTNAEGKRLALISSALIGDGATTCVAGEDAHFKLLARDYGGNTISKGGADVTIGCRAPGREPIEGVVVDNGDGTYNCTYSSIIAGDVEVILTSTEGTNQTKRLLNVKCEAAECEIDECRVDAGKMMLLWNAGDAGLIRVQRRDMYGNPTTKNTASGLNRFAAEVVGPGWADCEALELGDGSCELRLVAQAAGSYDISIVALAIDEDTMTPLDVPSVEVTSFSAIVSSQETFPSSCVARMALINAGGEETLADVDADITLPSTIMAGDQIAMHVLARDLHGNTTNWLGGERIAVHARGPTEIPFIPSESVGSFTTTITAAGAYSVAALVGDCACNGWPRILQVVAGPCNPDKCTVSGDALGTCTTATPISLLMQATDEYGNPRSLGGDLIEAVLMNKDEGTINIRVVDNSDGTYTLNFELDMPIEHELWISANGIREKRSRYSLLPSLGALQASDCVISGLSGERLLLADKSTLFVQPSNPSRVMSGREAVVVTVHLPSEMSFNLPLKFDESTRRFTCPLLWVEVGDHHITVTLAGEVVPGCPFVVRVHDPDEEFGEIEDEPQESNAMSMVPADNSFGFVYTNDSKTIAAARETQEEQEETETEDAQGGEGEDDEVEEETFIFGTALNPPPPQQVDSTVAIIRKLDLEDAGDALSDMRGEVAAAVLQRMNPQKAACAAAMMSPSELGTAVTLMREESVVSMLVEAPPAARASIIESLPPEAAAQALNCMDPRTASLSLNKLIDADVAAAILSKMKPSHAAQMLEFINADLQKQIFLELDPESMCSIITAAYDPVQPDSTRRGIHLTPESVSIIFTTIAPEVCAKMIRHMQTDALGCELAAGAMQRATRTHPRAVENILAMTQMTATDGGAAIKAAVLRQPGGDEIVANAESSIRKGEIEIPAPVVKTKTPKFRWGGTGLKPSKTASERAARSLSGMAPKVSAQALADMRPGAAGAVLAAMDSEHVSSIISVMGADVLANAIGSMDAEDALRVIVGSSPSVRVTIVESLPVGAQGSILSMLPAEEAADLLRAMDSSAALDAVHAMSARAAAIVLQELPEEQMSNYLLALPPSTASPILAKMCATEPGLKSASHALKILSETNPDKATSHLSGMLQRDAKSTAQVFSSFIVHSQGKVLSSFNAKDAGKMLQFLGPQNAAQALIEAVDGGTNAAVAAVALEALARLGVWPPSVDVPRFGVKVRGPLADVLLVMFELNPEHSALVLTALDPQVSASAIGAMSPATAGTLASAIPDPKIAALLLESMPHAKRAAMIIKMRPQPAADAASNMSVEHVVAIITTLYETQDPATMVIANDIISKMDSFKAGSVIVMLKEDFAVRILSALPPLVAADMISSGGLPSDKAGELLDRVKLDQAENVLSALPPSLAEEAVEKVSSTELKAKTASRTVVHLTSSLVSGPGCEECVAGLETKFIFESANPGGVRIHKGGASLHCDIYHLTFKAKDNSNEVEYIRGQAQEVNVQDMMNGSYEFTYKVDKAGEYDAVITSAGQTRTVRIKCKPAVLDPTQCAVAPLDENTRWRAGDVLVAKVLCRDRFGNDVAPPKSGDAAVDFVLLADGEGPSVVEAEIVDDPSGVGALAKFRATESGKYTLRVFTADVTRQWWGGVQRECIQGAPIELVLEASTADASRSSVQLSGIRERGGSMLLGLAGRQMAVVVFARDRFNNEAVFDKERLRVDAVGVTNSVFALSSKEAGEVMFTNALQRAGTYSLRVTVEGKAVHGFPRNLQVVAAQTDPRFCSIRGDALNRVIAGEVTKVLVNASDRYQNVCLEGGDRLTARLLGPAGSIDADTSDFGDGTYRLSFVVPRAGEWKVFLAVNGVENPKPATTFIAGQGGLTSKQLMLIPADKRDEFIVGSESIFYIQSLDYEIGGLEVNGHEAVCLRLITPSGLSTIVPLRLTKDKARYQAVVVWPEVGAHSLVAALNGEVIVGCPYSVQAAAAQVSLPGCKITGTGSTKAVAGERATFNIEARDARGNRMMCGGASISAVIQSSMTPGRSIKGSILDQGDGTYVCSYTINMAGPFTITVSSPSSTASLSATCVPGPADPAYCRIDASQVRQIEAGASGVVKVLRADCFDNLIPAGADLMPFRVEATGVGPADVETVEAGNGSAEIRFEARAVGRYTLYVWSGFKREPVLGSPCEIQVLPSQPAAAACKALLEGAEFKAQGVYSAQAGAVVTVRMQPRDRFGNSTGWKEWQTLTVTASGAEDIVFDEIDDDHTSSRGVFRTTFAKAGAYVIWVTVGGQTIVGWPRVLQIIPGTTNANVSSLRPESDTMALATELVRHGGNDASLIDALGRQSVDVDKLRGEMIVLREKLASYERAEHATGQHAIIDPNAEALTTQQVQKQNDKTLRLMVNETDSEANTVASEEDFVEATDADVFPDELDDPAAAEDEFTDAKAAP